MVNETLKAKEPLVQARLGRLSGLVPAVEIDLGRGVVITSSITMEAAKDLKLKKGDEAYAIIKASEVIVVKE